MAICRKKQCDVCGYAEMEKIKIWQKGFELAKATCDSYLYTFQWTKVGSKLRNLFKAYASSMQIGYAIRQHAMFANRKI